MLRCLPQRLIFAKFFAASALAHESSIAHSSLWLQKDIFLPHYSSWEAHMLYRATPQAPVKILLHVKPKNVYSEFFSLSEWPG